jgi:hypothetical protein
MAGTIKANTLQLGDSGIATNNFHLKTNVDGSLSLNRGNDGASTQEVLSITGTETVQRIMRFTAQASTSGTSIDFTGIPSWAKEITVMFAGVSTNSTSNILLQLGTSGGVQSTGYAGSSGYVGGTPVSTNPTNGFSIFHDTAADLFHGAVTFSQLNASTNIWVAQGFYSYSTRPFTLYTSGSVTLSGTLDRVRITTVAGTPTFDAGSINILVKG